MDVPTTSADTAPQTSNPFEFTSTPPDLEQPMQAAQAPQPPEEIPQDVPQPQAAPAGQPDQRGPEQAPAYQEQPEEYADDNGESSLIPGFTKPVKEETLLEWKAPVRPYKQQNRQVFTTLGVIGLLIGLILFFAGQLLPVAVVFATIFLVYVMYSTPPSYAVNKLTTYGIRVENNLYYWEEMGRFWFTQKFGNDILHIEISRFPDRLTILLGEIPKSAMEQILSEVLINEVPPPTTYEKIARWLHEKIPISLES